MRKKKRTSLVFVIAIQGMFPNTLGSMYIDLYNI